MKVFLKWIFKKELEEMVNQEANRIKRHYDLKRAFESNRVTNLLLSLYSLETQNDELQKLWKNAESQAEEYRLKYLALLKHTVE